jgi:hypothetical protein
MTHHQNGKPDMHKLTALIVLLATTLHCGHAATPEFQKVLKQRQANGETTKVLCDFDFEGATLDALQPKWTVIKGTYSVVDGVLHGEEIPADKHVSTAGMDLAIGKRALISPSGEITVPTPAGVV